MGHVHRLRREFGHQRRRRLLEEAITCLFRFESEHGRLLGDLAAAADDRERRRALQAIQQLPPFQFDERAEIRLIGRIIEIGEGQIVPDQDAFVVAGAMEGVGFRHGGAGNAQHVHAGVARLPDQRAGIGAARRKWIRRHPAGAATKHRFAVDAQGETAAIRAAVDGKRTKADAPEIEAGVGDGQNDGVRGRFAMGVGPPRRDVVDDERAAEAARSKAIE